MKTCIFGGPRTGKTTRAAEIVGSKGLRRVRHTDDLINRLPWSQASQHIADDWHPVVDRTPGQVSMGTGCATVWAQIEPDLLARGVRVVKL